MRRLHTLPLRSISQVVKAHSRPLVALAYLAKVDTTRLTACIVALNKNQLLQLANLINGLIITLSHLLQVIHLRLSTTSK